MSLIANNLLPIFHNNRIRVRAYIFITLLGDLKNTDHQRRNITNNI